MDSDYGWVEALVHRNEEQGDSFDKACKKVLEKFEALVPGVSEAVAELKEMRKGRIIREERGRAGNTSTGQDIREMGWYPGPSADGVWTQLKERMIFSGLEAAIDGINSSTSAIVASIAEPYVHSDRRLGLVIGNVQSGKTANFSAVIAKALDEGYRFVLVLSGIHNNLRKQTQERLERDLGLIDDARDWFRLTSADGDFGTAFKDNASSIVSTNKRVLAVVKKNVSRLHNVLDFLRAIDEQTLKKTPFLIIDDESDQATPDSSPTPENDPTKINQLMREIWAEVHNGTYVGYTATPFANIFMDPNSESTGNLEELYPKDFIHVMPTPKNYFGAERIFGLEGDTSERVTPDIVREIDKKEQKQLSPEKGVDPTVTKSLGDAIRWFIVASAIRRSRGQNKKHSTMLIHTTHRVDPHFAMRDAVKVFLGPIQHAAREDDVESFRTIFHQERDRAAELYTGDHGAPSWQIVSQEIPNVLRSLRLSVDNGSAETTERLAYPEDTPQTVIVIGGGTLSRGLTLEGLFVSYFARTSNAYDTLLQMGRWFGYRTAYEDLQRVWLGSGLEDDYRFLATIENEVRMEIRRMAGANQTPKEIGVRVRLHPGRLQITSPAKMKHVKIAQADFEGFRLQTTLFDMDTPSLHDNNVDTSLLLRKALTPYRDANDSSLHLDVPIGKLEDFFKNFHVHSRFQENFTNSYNWANDKLSQKTWNVVIPFRQDSSTFDLISRTPINTSTSTVENSHHINIRSLMSDGDIVRDLQKSSDQTMKIGRKMSHNEQLNLRQDPAGLDGRGLLILYPIDRNSKIKKDSEHRVNMDEALRRVSPELLSDPALPLMGIALVAPWDTGHELEEKGTTVSVQPLFEADDDEIGENIEDTEGSYRG